MGNLFARPRRNSTAQFDNIPDGVPVAEATVVQPTRTPSSNAGAADTAASPCALSISADKVSLSSTEAQSILAMLSIKAPTAPNDVERAPLDLVACIDKSGSMHGEKMRLMRQTLELLVTRAGLNANDRISLVTFDNMVKVELPLSRMDGDGKAKAEGVVKQVRPGATTNLSGGALKAIDVLDASAEASWPFWDAKKSDGRTRAVMLFTDGLANEGIREPGRLCQAVNGALQAASAKLGGPISLITFGFGADHNENCLRALANESGSGGLYYYVKDADAIPDAFADCLGGLTSVVAQNATLSLDTIGEGVEVKRILGSTYKRDENGAILLGDLFSEDSKDVLVELTLPRLSTPNAEPTPIVNATLKAFNITRSAPDAITASLRIARPEVTPPDQPVNTSLDEQRNRIEAAEAMEEASRMADAGDLAGGRNRLALARQHIFSSATSGEAFSASLMSQVAEVEDTFSSEVQYRSVGSKMAKMQSLSHQRQRANHSNVGDYGAGAKRKAAMKAAWGLSSIGSFAGKGNDSDSD